MWFDFWCLCLAQVAWLFWVDLLLCLLCLSWVCAMWFCFFCCALVNLFLWVQLTMVCYLLVVEFAWRSLFWLLHVRFALWVCLVCCLLCLDCVCETFVCFQVWIMRFDFCKLTCCTVCVSCIALLWLEFFVFFRCVVVCGWVVVQFAFLGLSWCDFSLLF